MLRYYNLYVCYYFNIICRVTLLKMTDKKITITPHINKFFKPISKEVKETQRLLDLAVFNAKKNHANILQQNENNNRAAELKLLKAKQIEENEVVISFTDDKVKDKVIIRESNARDEEVIIIGDDDMCFTADVIIRKESTEHETQTKRVYAKRSPNWKLITEFHIQNGKKVAHTLSIFKQYFNGMSYNAKRTTLKRWIKDLERNKLPSRD